MLVIKRPSSIAPFSTKNCGRMMLDAMFDGCRDRFCSTGCRSYKSWQSNETSQALVKGAEPASALSHRTCRGRRLAESLLRWERKGDDDPGIRPNLRTPPCFAFFPV